MSIAFHYFELYTKPFVSKPKLAIHKLSSLGILEYSLNQLTNKSVNFVSNFSGSSGSGKTYSSMVILRQLFNVVGGGPETDAFKHLAAAFTVLRSLGSAKTINNSESSRIVKDIFVVLVCSKCLLF